jgi:hypothetical protein
MCFGRLLTVRRHVMKNATCEQNATFEGGGGVLGPVKPCATDDLAHLYQIVVWIETHLS